jgi:hypothetical protein
MERHPEVRLWLCPGDLADEQGQYPAPRAPLYWIKGNNENFEFVVDQPAGGGTVRHLHYIPNGVEVAASGLRLAGLGGTFAPNWYDTAPDALPVMKGKRAGLLDDKRRHFVRAEVDVCKLMRGIDVFLSHEAARPYLIEQRGAAGLSRKTDAGKTPVNEVLAAMKPRLHLFGHHHRYSVSERQHVVSIGLEMVTTSYLIFDGKTLAHQRFGT